MKEPKIKSVVIVPHSESCSGKDGKSNPWSGITSGHYWGNFKANQNNRGNHHLWHKVLCNNATCNGIKAVHSWVLINA